jgi:hypothetical protein
MNSNLIKLGVKSTLLNYVDNETPRVHFVSSYADLTDIEEYTKMVIDQIVKINRESGLLTGMQLSILESKYCEWIEDD